MRFYGDEQDCHTIVWHSEIDEKFLIDKQETVRNYVADNVDENNTKYNEWKQQWC